MPVSELLQVITGLEQQIWQAVVQKDGTRLAELFTDDYLEITLEGQRVERDAIVSQSPQVDDISHYTMNEARVIPLSTDSLLLSYHLTLAGQCRGEDIIPTDRWATSIWTQTDGQWRCRFFQQTAYAPNNRE